MVTAQQDAFEDLIGGGVIAQYSDYELTDLPPSICTSDVDAYGDTYGGPTRVYANESMTVSVHADNIGSSSSVTTTGPADFYIGVEVPADTTYASGSATNSAVYTDDLSTVAASFPAVAGVYWTGPVTRTDDFAAQFTVDAGLMDGDRITATVHFADSALAVPDQYFTDEDVVGVISPFALSAAAAEEEFYAAGADADFVFNILNLSNQSRDVALTMYVPVSTTLVGVGAGDMSTTAAMNSVVINDTIEPYATDGATPYVLSVRLDSNLAPETTIEAMAHLKVQATGDMFELSATTDVGYSLYLPIITK
jgi:hypothetical protein